MKTKETKPIGAIRKSKQKGNGIGLQLEKGQRKELLGTLSAGRRQREMKLQGVGNRPLGPEKIAINMPGGKGAHGGERAGLRGPGDT